MGNQPMRLQLLVVLLFLLTAVIVVFAAPDDRFLGGNYDGYDVSCTNNAAFPQPPPTGTVIMISG